MKVEKICRLNNIPYSIRPVPTHISSECGMCIEIDPKFSDSLQEKIKSNNINYDIINI